MAYIIKSLQESSHIAPILAYWAFSQWYTDRNVPFSVLVKDYQQRALTDSITLTLIAFDDDLPVGMVSIKEGDLWSRKELNPWMTSLYVVPHYRRRGIAEGLMSAIKNVASERHYGRLYLYIQHRELENLEKYYNSRGWLFFEHALDNDGCPTKIFYAPLR